jgi:hypothetical protein
MCEPSTDREDRLEGPRGQQNCVSAMRNDAQADSARFTLLASELDPFFSSLSVRAASTRTDPAEVLRHPRAVSMLHIPNPSTIA